MLNMKNNFILCDDKKDDVNESSSGFVTSNATRFKTVKVIQSSEEDVPVGSEVRISVNAGEEDEIGLVIRRTDIIYVL
jgi:hypothetical protein